MTDKFAPIAALTHTDAYKLGHINMYPKGTTGVLSNYTNRGSRIDGITSVVHFGLQGFLESWATRAWEPFFAASEDEVANLYEEFVTSILGPNTVGSDHIRALHKLGYLPLVFKGLPEGTLVPLRVPSFTVENTLPEFFWLVNYIETALSASYWLPSTSATTAHHLRKLLDDWAIKTTGSTDGVDFQGHDFSFRGMSGIEAAAASGAGHALSFKGSDNLHVVGWVNENYDGDNGLIVASVPATEHSVATSFGPDGDQAYFEHLLDIHPTGILSAVSDSYDLWATITETLPAIKDRIMARDGKLVIRPDSGNPVDILTGTLGRGMDAISDSGEKREYYQGLVQESRDTSPEQKGVVELLWNVFGGTVNEQGYKVLDPHIGVIYGDSINYDRALQIMQRLEAKGFASTNVVFGVGSFTYQYVTRDTFMSAVKATWVEINGEGKAIYKDPKTDNGTKKSAKGRLAVVESVGVDGEDDVFLADGDLGAKWENTDKNLLQEVWRDGKFVRYQSYAEVREVLASQR